jgi:hypothetical protein
MPASAVLSLARELHERLAQVVLGGARIDEQPRDVGRPQRQVVELLVDLAYGDNDRDSLGAEAAGDERDRACRHVVEPLRVIDDAQRSWMGDDGMHDCAAGG